MRPPLIIGIGNPTRSDDGAGPRVVTALARLIPWGDYRVVQQLTPELAYDLSQAHEVLFVDASVAAAGLQATVVVPSDMPVGTHVASPGALLQLTAQLYGQAPARALEVAIPAHDLGFGEELSPATERWVGQAVTRLAAYLDGEPGGPWLPQ